MKLLLMANNLFLRWNSSLPVASVKILRPEMDMTLPLHLHTSRPLVSVMLKSSPVKEPDITPFSFILRVTGWGWQNSVSTPRGGLNGWRAIAAEWPMCRWELPTLMADCYPWDEYLCSGRRKREEIDSREESIMIRSFATEDPSRQRADVCSCTTVSASSGAWSADHSQPRPRATVATNHSMTSVGLANLIRTPRHSLHPTPGQISTDQVRFNTLFGHSNMSIEQRGCECVLVSGCKTWRLVARVRQLVNDKRDVKRAQPKRLGNRSSRSSSLPSTRLLP